MLWVDTVVAEIKTQLKDKIAAGEELVVRDEKTASGRVHVGSMRGVAIHDVVTNALDREGIAARFLYEINDFDPMDGLPTYLEKEVYEQHMGKPLYMVPAPEEGASNFAEYYAGEYTEVITEAGFTPEFYRASELYLSGKMNDVIAIALERADDIRAIYKDTSGAEKGSDWLPLSVVCENCGKIGTTNATYFDGERVAYVCRTDHVEWAVGCEHESSTSPFDGRAKLPWKVEWAAKFKVLGVDVEGGGKDHSTRGGARDVANRIARDVFDYAPPFDIPYEFFLVDGKKMSSSKGAGSSAREVADLLPPVIFRLALIGKKPMQAINFEPSGDTVPTLFDRYDELARKYWDGVEDDEARLFMLIHTDDAPEEHYLMRFSNVAFLSQMPHIDVHAEAEKGKGAPLSEVEQKVLDERIAYAHEWLKTYAPERHVFALQTEAIPDLARDLTDAQRAALRDVLAYIQATDELSGADLHSKLHEIKEAHGIAPRELFTALYVSFLGRESGPQAGWFLSVLPRDFLMSRLTEVTS